jgi:hypothetical protein
VKKLGQKYKLQQLSKQLKSVWYKNVKQLS